jgi:hypothetical protein
MSCTTTQSIAEVEVTWAVVLARETPSPALILVQENRQSRTSGLSAFDHRGMYAALYIATAETKPERWAEQEGGRSLRPALGRQNPGGGVR